MSALEPFLARAGWADATRLPLAGDASTRAYLRLKRSGESAIVMLAPAEDRSSFESFLAIAVHLRALGLSAPEIMAHEADNGLMLMEDFGDTALAGLTDDWLEAAGETLNVLHHLATSRTDWALPRFTPEGMAEMTRISLPDTPETDRALSHMADSFAPLFTRPLTAALRDVHAENLHWLPARSGPARIGLLDFQDAVMAPLGYDLISFIHDARRDLPHTICEDLTARFCAEMQLDPSAFARDCALLSLQRNLRILGVFRRLAETRGKPAYLAHLPRVHGYVVRALEHPDLAALRRHLSPLLQSIAP